MRISDSVLHGSCMMAPVMWDGGLLVKSTTGLNFVVQSYDVRSRRAVSQCGVSDSKVGRVIDPEEQADRLSVPTDWRQPPLLLSPFLSRSGTPSIECTIDSREHDLRIVCATDQSTRPKIDMTSGHSIWKMPKVREISREKLESNHSRYARECIYYQRNLALSFSEVSEWILIVLVPSCERKCSLKEVQNREGPNLLVRYWWLVLPRV